MAKDRQEQPGNFLDLDRPKQTAAQHKQLTVAYPWLQGFCAASNSIVVKQNSSVKIVAGRRGVLRRAQSCQAGS